MPPAPKPVTLRSEKYMAWIRTLPCIVHRCHNPSQAHHAGGLEAGRGKDHKGSDYRCLPVCPWHHVVIHDDGQADFFQYYNLDRDLLIIEFLEVWAAKMEAR